MLNLFPDESWGSLWPLYACALPTLMVACFAFKRGLGWRRQTIPPSCRTCGYNVSHRPAGIETCSECGADLRAAKAISTERRSAHRGIAIPAMVVIVLATYWSTVFVTRFSWRTWYFDQAPLAFIRYRAEHDHGMGGEEYRHAWSRRAGGSPEFIDHLLDLQVSGPNVQSGLWDMELSRAYDEGQLSPAQRRRLCGQLFVPLTYRLRTRVRQGDPIIITADAASARPLGTSFFFRLRGTVAVRVDGTAKIVESPERWPGLNDPAYFRTELTYDEWSGGAAVPPGKHRLNIAHRRGLEKFGFDRDIAPADRIDYHQDVEIEVLPERSRIGTAVPAPEKADAIAKAMDVRYESTGGGSANACVVLLPADVDRSFSIYVEIDGKRQLVGSTTAPAGSDSTYTIIHTSVEGSPKPPDRVTIVLVGDDDPLKYTLDQYTYWPGRVTFPDVPLDTTIRDWRAPSRPPSPTTLPFTVEPGR